MRQNTVDLEAIAHDTLDAIHFQYKVNGDSLDLTDYEIKVDIREFNTNRLIKSLEVEIIDAVDGKFDIKEQLLDVDGGNYIYDIQLTSPEGIVKTWIYGKFKIYRDVTD